MSHSFTAPWWARNPHLQTILPVLTKVPRPKLQRERLELPDGDFLDLDWQQTPANGEPVLVLIHGLEGSAQSHYARRMLLECRNQGLAAVVHHHRSCSGMPNRLSRSYHSGDTEDLAFSLRHIASRFPHSPLLAVGYSLGGNVLAKFQGEQGEHSPLTRAAVVSAPLTLSACAKRLEKGFSRVYQSYLLRQLQQKLRAKIANPAMQMPVSADKVDSLNTFKEFDDKVTAPLHGFTGVDDYYHRASGLPFLGRITSPTLVLHAADDPFMTEAVIPTQAQLSGAVHYELYPHGGHVGFIDGGHPFKPRYFLERRVLAFLTDRS
ncbi:hydrolase [Shewanella cyperi]|uniref:Hydrolase n=1 Tax=Shewanella cyperi TaxID=2814292 RepID=A0A974XS34_9GAMM|nr:hydrolase [Shewanella cyperi]QSX29454.1 hydrolase [Shewanella cyperi]